VEAASDRRVKKMSTERSSPIRQDPQVNGEPGYSSQIRVP